VQPYFLNVDLEIESASKLDSLVTAMGKRVLVLHSGPGSTKRHLLALEILRDQKGADATIHALCAVVEGMPPAPRRAWNAAARKEFDVGYQLRPSERLLRCTLRRDTLERMARLGATLAITCYRGGANDA
jgi:hypothetical protein